MAITTKRVCDFCGAPGFYKFTRLYEGNTFSVTVTAWDGSRIDLCWKHFYELVASLGEDGYPLPPKECIHSGDGRQHTIVRIDGNMYRCNGCGTGYKWVHRFMSYVVM